MTVPDFSPSPPAFPPFFSNTLPSFFNLGLRHCRSMQDFKPPEFRSFFRFTQISLLLFSWPPIPPFLLFSSPSGVKDVHYIPPSHTWPHKCRASVLLAREHWIDDLSSPPSAFSFNGKLVPLPPLDIERRLRLRRFFETATAASMFLSLWTVFFSILFADPLSQGPVDFFH